MLPDRRNLDMGCSSAWRLSLYQRFKATRNMYVRAILRLHLFFISSYIAQHSILVDWADNGRDILNFLLNYLPENSASGSDALPMHLERVPDALSERRTKHGFSDRNFVCVGHSFGGASL